MTAPLSNNAAGAIFLGVFATLIVGGQWYAVFHFDPPFRFLGGRDVHGYPFGYAFSAAMFGAAACFWRLRWRRWLIGPDEPGSKAVGWVVGTALTLMALSFAVTAYRASLLFDYAEWKSGGTGYDWRRAELALDRPASAPREAP